MSGLLATDPHMRLTAAQAMCHPGFDGFDWEAFACGSMGPPAIPVYHQMPNERPGVRKPTLLAGADCPAAAG